MAITLRPDGKFDVRVSKMIAGQHVERRKRGLATKGEARRVEEELKAELLLLKQKGWSAIITWAAALEDYYADSSKKHSVATYSSAKAVLEAHSSVWKDRPVDSVTTAEIEQQVETSMFGRSAASKRKLVQYIRAVFKRQRELGRINFNPCDGIRFGKISEKELIAMTRDEIVLLLSEAKRLDHPWYPIWRVVYELGLRSGEALALRWSDVNFEIGRVTISRSYCSKSNVIGATKNRKTRSVALNPALTVFLKSLKDAGDPNGFVLPQFAEWKRGEAAKTLRAFQIEHGIRPTNFHSLRASFITHLLLKGVPVTQVQYMVGHADLKTTQRYVRLVGADIQGATDALSLDLS